jgi:hypothetical protein
MNSGPISKLCMSSPPSGLDGKLASADAKFFSMRVAVLPDCQILLPVGCRGENAVAGSCVKPPRVLRRRQKPTRCRAGIARIGRTRPCGAVFLPMFLLDFGEGDTAALLR